MSSKKNYKKTFLFYDFYDMIFMTKKERINHENKYTNT